MILVFKTNVKNKTQIKNIKLFLDANLRSVKWNFDLEDSDKIFKVECSKNINEVIINIFMSAGFICEELID